MQGQFDTARLSQIEYKEPVIKKGDLLSIRVYSDNAAASAIYNEGGAPVTPSTLSGPIAASSTASGPAESVGGTSSTPGGYLVDERGNIELPQFGLFHVAELTRSELKDSLETRLKEFLHNAYVTIRFLNYRFTMLGEITHPGIFNIPGDHINLMEALGLGGDLTFFGRRDNILVIRENNGKREFGRLDLTKPEVMASPYFYLQPNDVVYIEANRKKIANNDQTTIRTISVSASVISTLALLYSIFRN
jgi:polysaccharide export outer membrane protein